MRFWQYLLALAKFSRKDFERAEAWEVVVTSVIGLLLMVLTVVGYLGRDRIGEAPAWVSGIAFILLFFFVAPFKAWLSATRKIEEFEEAAKPKVVLGDPEEEFSPGGKYRKWHLRVINTSTVPIKNCFVKMESMINKDGKESVHRDNRFKWGTDNPIMNYGAGFEYTQQKDLAPSSGEFIDIAEMDETQAPADALVTILYALKKESFAYSYIKPVVFPHTLKIQVCADNLTSPVSATYVLSVEDGKLKMRKA